MVDQTIVASFDQSVLYYLDIKHPNLNRSSGPIDMLSFYAAYLFRAPLPESFFKFKVLQLPFHKILFYTLGIGTKDFNDYAKKYGIATKYWTVNNADDMKILKENGADGVITDYPDRAWLTFYDNQTILNGYKLYSILNAPTQYSSLAIQQINLIRNISNNIFNQFISHIQNPLLQKINFTLF
ncbi:hypothetical protein GKC56_03615 [Neisseriaceae bacterium PsAf]|nr:hypothetical protein [Neisseriaceae bacterium PsAf]